MRFADVFAAPKQQAENKSEDDSIDLGNCEKVDYLAGLNFNVLELRVANVPPRCLP